jgi:hypothetical protein
VDEAHSSEHGDSMRSSERIAGTSSGSVGGDRTRAWMQRTRSPTCSSSPGGGSTTYRKETKLGCGSMPRHAVIANQRRSSRRGLALRERLGRERSAGAAEVFPCVSTESVVREALRRLRPRDREVLLLTEWEDLTPAEIGTVLGCLTVTARGRLHRARFRFRVTFEEL